MDLTNTPVATVRHDGWTPARKAQFLDHLGQDGSVLAACAHVGLSREAAYRLRRRDPLFARAWAAAQALARVACGQVLGTRAIDGIEEEVWYRGEVLGTRRRYDNRLLLAHVARLDRLVEADKLAQADAGRFDELLARVAGVEIPEELPSSDGDLPVTRYQHLKAACDEADRTAHRAAEDAEREHHEAGNDPFDEAHKGEWDAFDAATAAAWHEAYTGAAAEWDAWFDEVCAIVDGMLAQPSARLEADLALRTLSPLSTSPSAAAGADEPPQSPSA